MTNPAIGFIGLGLMGRAMVECLQKAGHDVTVLGHRDRTGVEVALARGGTEATSARSLAASTDIVMLRVGVSAQVECRICGGDRMLMGDMGGCDKVKPVLDVLGERLSPRQAWQRAHDQAHRPLLRHDHGLRPVRGLRARR